MAKSGLVRTLISALPMAYSVIGCGGDKPDPTLAGRWGLERGDGCVVGLELGEAGEYRHAVGCRLEGGGAGVERYEGSYAVDGTRLGIWLTHSTCPGDEREYVVDYTLDGDRLTIDEPGGRLVLERIKGEGSSGALRNGCWDGDEITFSELRPLE